MLVIKLNKDNANIYGSNKNSFACKEEDMLESY
jgi:hypothetical protein